MEDEERVDVRLRGKRGQWQGKPCCLRRLDEGGHGMVETGGKMSLESS